MGKGGGDVEYTQSPEQRQIYSEILPIIQMMGEGAKSGMAPWGNLPSAPGPRPYPSMSNFGRYDVGYGGQPRFGGGGKGGFGGQPPGNPVWDQIQAGIPQNPTTPAAPQPPPGNPYDPPGTVPGSGLNPDTGGKIGVDEFRQFWPQAAVDPAHQEPAAGNLSGVSGAENYATGALTGPGGGAQSPFGGGGVPGGFGAAGGNRGGFRTPGTPPGNRLGGIPGSIIGSPIMPGQGQSGRGGGVLSGVPSYNIPGYGVGGYNVPNVPGASGYNVPNAPNTDGYNVPGAVTPSAGWFEGMSPDVKAGMWEPYKEAGNQMLEVMGARGQGGSPRGGYSGAAGTAMGELFADAGSQVGLDAWQMQQPGLMAEFGARLGQNRDVWGQNAGNQMAQWQANLGQNRDVWNRSGNNAMEQWRANLGQNQFQAQGNLDRNRWLAQQNLLRNIGERGEFQQERMGDYNQSLAYRQALQNMDMTNFQNTVSGIQFPFQMLPGLAGGTYSQGVVPNQTNMAQGVGSGLMAGGGAMLAGANPLLAGMMGLGGLLGGK